MAEQAVQVAKPKNSKGWRETLTAYGYLLPATLGLVLFIVYPMFNAFWLAFQDAKIGQPSTFVGLDNFRRMFVDDPLFWNAVKSTVILTVISVPLNMILALGLALLIAPHIKGRTIIRVLFFIPVVAPVVASAAVFRLMFANNGMINLFLEKFGIDGPNWTLEMPWAIVAIVILTVWQSLGYNIIIFSAALDGVPESVIEASYMDGATKFHTYRHVIIPMITPSIFFGLVMTLIGAFQIFDQPFILTEGGPSGRTTTLVMLMYRRGFDSGLQGQMGYASAIGLFVFAVIMVITAINFAAQKKWVHYES